MNQLMLTALPDIPLVETGDDLAHIILRSLDKAQIKLHTGDVLVLAQKIVSKAEGRWVDLKTVEPGPQAIELAQKVEKDSRVIELILRESRQIIRQRPGLVIAEHRLGFICANAGIDHSNVRGPEDWVLMLPEAPDRSAASLRAALEESSGASLGVMIIDSHGRAWRNGTVGITIGLSGVPGVVDRRGETDLFGYEMRATEVGAADELAAAASLLMGQVAEGTPVVHVRGFPYPLRESAMGEMLREKEADLFR